MPDRPSLFPAESRPSPAAQPQSGWISAHCDGGARGNPGPAGFGAVIQGANGALLGELSEFLGIRTNNFAEYSGLLASLDFALQHGHRRLRVTSDSELMVKQIQGKYQVKSPDLRPLYEAAKKKIAQLDGFEITHALRHKNKAADALANQAMDRGTNRADQNIRTVPATKSPGSSSSVASKPGGPSFPVLPERAGSSRESANRTPAPVANSAPAKVSAPPSGTMLRGFVKEGTVHLLGSHTLPDGTFVKIILE